MRICRTSTYGAVFAMGQERMPTGISLITHYMAGAPTRTLVVAPNTCAWSRIRSLRKAAARQTAEG